MINNSSSGKISNDILLFNHYTVYAVDESKNVFYSEVTCTSH